MTTAPHPEVLMSVPATCNELITGDWARPGFVERAVSRLWSGPYKRYVKGLVGRMLQRKGPVVLGPMRGIAYDGTLEARLGILELHVQYVLSHYLRPGGIFFDVGAHLGYLSLLAAHRVGPTGKVYAFEPVAPNRRRLQAAADANGLAHLTTVPFVISDRCGAATVFYDADTSEASLFRRASHDETVAAITLDTFCATHEAPDLVKVDVEGAEELVMAGATTLLSSDPAPVWVIELHTAQLERAVVGRLRAHGYQVRLLPSWYASPKHYPRHIVAIKGRAF